MSPSNVPTVGATPAVRDELFTHRLRPLTVLGSTGAEYKEFLQVFLLLALAGALVLVLF